MGYTNKPRAFGEAPRPLGDHSSSSEEEEESSSSTDEEDEADASPSKAGGSEGLSIYDMMRQAEEGAAKLEGRTLDSEQAS